MLKVEALKTSVFRRGENLESFLKNHLAQKLRENTIVAITSKILSVAEEAVVSKKELTKRELIQSEADEFLCETIHGVCLTIKDGLLIPTAGIDESNSESDQNGDDYYLVYPKDPYASAKRIWGFLREISGVKNLGVVITDSHTTALRKGVIGIALAHWGFVPVKSFIGKEDLFGRKLQMTSVNVLDALAVAAVLCMGESNECQPIALLSYAEAEFCEDSSPEEIQMPFSEDLYAPLLTALREKKT